MGAKSLINIMNCQNCNNDAVGVVIKKENIYLKNKWYIKKTQNFLCKKHFLNKKKLSKIKYDIFQSNQKIIKNLSIVSKMKIQNNLGIDLIDQMDLNVLINGLKYIKQCN